MPRYHVDVRTAGSQQALAAAFKTQISMFAASGGVGSRGQLVSLSMALDGAPNATDCQIIYMVQRLTADGTGTVTTANSLDNQDITIASRATTKTNYTAEGTLASNLFLRVMNQRAAMQWNAQDDPAKPRWNGVQPNTAGTAPNGLAIVCSGGSTPVTAPAGTSAEFDE